MNYGNMAQITSLQNHKRLPSDHFGQAAALVESGAILIPCADTDDVCLRGGFRMEAINEIFEKRRNATETDEGWMFLQLYKLMHKVQEETANREVSEARDRLLAILTGLSDKSLEKIATLDLGIYESYVPSDALLRFCAMASDKRRECRVRGQKALHTAEILTFSRDH